MNQAVLNDLISEERKTQLRYFIDTAVKEMDAKYSRISHNAIVFNSYDELDIISTIPSLFEKARFGTYKFQILTRDISFVEEEIDETSEFFEGDSEFIYLWDYFESRYKDIYWIVSNCSQQKSMTIDTYLVVTPEE